MSDVIAIKPHSVKCTVVYLINAAFFYGTDSILWLVLQLVRFKVYSLYAVLSSIAAVEYFCLGVLW